MGDREGVKESGAGYLGQDSTKRYSTSDSLQNDLHGALSKADGPHAVAAQPHIHIQAHNRTQHIHIQAHSTAQHTHIQTHNTTQHIHIQAHTGKAQSYTPRHQRLP